MLEHLASRWADASMRERTLVFIAGIVLAIGIGWPLVWQPLERDLARVDEARRNVRFRTVAARAMADEIAGLSRTAQAASATDPRTAVDRALGAHELRGALTALDVDDARVHVTFATIDLDVLARLVDALGRDEKLFVVEALLAASVVPGSVRAELTLARPASR